MMDRRGSWIWMEIRWDAPSFEERKEEKKLCNKPGKSGKKHPETGLWWEAANLIKFFKGQDCQLRYTEQT